MVLLSAFRSPSSSYDETHALGVLPECFGEGCCVSSDEHPNHLVYMHRLSPVLSLCDLLGSQFAAILILPEEVGIWDNQSANSPLFKHAAKYLPGCNSGSWISFLFSRLAL
jgi:hypothetical protein